MSRTRNFSRGTEPVNGTDVNTALMFPPIISLMASKGGTRLLFFGWKSKANGVSIKNQCSLLAQENYKPRPTAEAGGDLRGRPLKCTIINPAMNYEALPFTGYLTHAYEPGTSENKQVFRGTANSLDFKTGVKGDEIIPDESRQNVCRK